MVSDTPCLMPLQRLERVLMCRSGLSSRWNTSYYMHFVQIYWIYGIRGRTWKNWGEHCLHKMTRNDNSCSLILGIFKSHMHKAFYKVLVLKVSIILPATDFPRKGRMGIKTVRVLSIFLPRFLYDKQMWMPLEIPVVHWCLWMWWWLWKFGGP